MSTRLLFVAMADSPHTAGWLSLLDRTGWEIFVIAPYTTDPVAGVPARRVSVLSHGPQGLVSPLPGAFGHLAERVLDKFVGRERWRPDLVKLAVRALKPDLVHSLEFQHCGYLCLAARESSDAFPPWAATNWGSDIRLFGSDIEHTDRIDRLLQQIDFYGAECHRDIDIARERGCTASAFPVVPNNGGFDLELAACLRSTNPSRRKLIMVKGYEHFAGRALTALAALERIRDELTEYQICVYSCTDQVVHRVNQMRRESDMNIRVIANVRNEEMLRLHGQARVSLAAGVSDGISISMLEAMVMGSYPIQTVGACADEWVVHRANGALIEVSVDQIIEEMRYALSDDDVVEAAAERNEAIARERLDRELIRPRVVSAYTDALTT